MLRGRWRRLGRCVVGKAQSHNQRDRRAGGGSDRGRHDPTPDPEDHSRTRLNVREFAITDTDDKLIAALANTGLSRMPKMGYSTPAAIGTPSAL